MRSSKTIQYRQRLNRIPVVESVNSVLCPVRVLRLYISRSERRSSDRLFGFGYEAYNKRLKSLCHSIGLHGHYSTHSVRRGSASYLSTFMPLHDVKAYGDWRSWSVLLYLADNYTSRMSKDYLVAEKLSEFR